MFANFQLLMLQINAEKYFFNIRKSLVEFDEVLEVRILLTFLLLKFFILMQNVPLKYINELGTF